MSDAQQSGAVLITGAGGFIGRHLAADQAARGRRVVAMDVDLSAVAHLQSPGRFELLERSICSPEHRATALREFGQVDTVFHLAAVHLGARHGEADFQRVNVEASEALALDAASAGVGRFVHCSSVGVYGRIESPPADESTPCAPRLAYERTKLAGEKAVLGAGARSGLATIALRPA